MKEAKISQIKNQLSRYLAFVRRGEVVRILDRDVPVAQIVPIGDPRAGVPLDSAALIALERKGILRRGSGRIPREILDRDPAGPETGAIDALVQERSRR